MAINIERNIVCLGYLWHRLVNGKCTSCGAFVGACPICGIFNVTHTHATIT